MRKTLFITLFYSLYLILLGQGCSALKTDEGSFVISLPKLSLPKKVNLPEPPPITLAENEKNAPKVQTIVPQIVAKNKESKIKEESYLESRYRVLPKTEINKVAEKIEVTRPNEHKDQVLPLVAITKNFEVSEVIQEDKKLPKDRSENIVHEKMKIEANKFALNDKMGFEHNGFEVEIKEEIASTLWISSLVNGLEERMATISNDGAKEKSSAIAANSEPTIENFVNDENDFSDIVKKKESSTAKVDDLIFLDYSKQKPAIEFKKSLSKKISTALAASSPVSNGFVSSSVDDVIRREMGIESKNAKNNKLLAMNRVPKGGSMRELVHQLMPNKRTQPLGPSKNKERDRKSRVQENQATLYAIEADLKKGFQDEVRNFDFTPSYDSNISLRDFNEGSISVEYSLKNQTGLLRGTILKNHFLRTTFEIPLGSEYSKFEIPLITKESLGDYLDENELDGYGGYFLVDLGELIEDVDIEKTSNDKSLAYEHRVLLNDNFKPVKDGSDYRYVLFIGVIPGSLNVRYLGVNGQETSKLTFIVADEMSYDFSQIERPHLLNFKTKVRNTLGSNSAPIDLSIESITSFLDEENPAKIAEASYEIKVPWSVKGMRNYFEFKYLEDSIFVGIDSDQNIELPSKEFIGEILQSFNMDSLGAECFLQLNFSNSVSEVSIQAESEKGPANFDHTYLDRDGVFSPELSPLSQKFFAVGYEEGIYSIKVKYEDGRSDYLRTYCSPSTYLLEQL